MTRVLILGAGITGASLAFRLAQAGHQVTVVDAGLPAGGASGASFGWINASFYLSEPHFHLRSAAIAAHHRLAADLPDSRHDWSGCLWCEDAGDHLDQTAQALTRLGYPLRILSRDQIAAREPHLAAPPDRALYFPSEGAVDLAHLTRRQLQDAARLGARLLFGVAATALLVRAGTVAGAVTVSGQIEADLTILATGSGTPRLLAPLGLAFPMLQRPGLILATRPLPPVLSHILCTPDGEVRQDAEGRLLAPASAQHQSDSAESVPDAARSIQDTLARLERTFRLPKLELDSATLSERPVPGDGLPALGAVPGLPGAMMAVMHSGATLAPLAADCLAAEISGTKPPFDLADFRPGRLM